MAYADQTTIDRFLSNVAVGAPDECWPWKLSLTKDGHGRWRNSTAHRWAYRLFSGSIGEGLVVRHKCDFGACCNPAHLELGTHSDNRADCVSRQRHARADTSGRAKITSDVALAIRTAKLTDRKAAAQFGLSISAVKSIRSGRTWPEAGGLDTMDRRKLRTTIRNVYLSRGKESGFMVGDNGFEPLTSSM